jgi:hypothetical protein
MFGSAEEGFDISYRDIPILEHGKTPQEALRLMADKLDEKEIEISEDRNNEVFELRVSTGDNGTFKAQIKSEEATPTVWWGGAGKTRKEAIHSVVHLFTCVGSPPQGVQL